jgi:lysophospholipase L1-like esterase
MKPAAVRTVLALATVFAAATCHFRDSALPPRHLTEGEPPLSVIGPPAPRPLPTLASEDTGTLGKAAPLVPLFAALEAIDTGAGTTPVVMIQLGDSHSAADLLSGRLRERFQQRFGAAGRGMLPPGIPYPYYRPDFVQVAENGGWRRAISFRESGPFGITAALQQSTQPDARMMLTETEPAGFNRGFFEVLRQPGGGAVRLRVDDGGIYAFVTEAPEPAPHWIEFDAPPNSHRFSLAADSERPVTLLAWGTQRQVPGVVYENFGINGATVDIVGHWNPAAVSDELSRRDPALIIVAYGTNEAMQNASWLASYAEKFAGRVKELSAMAPQAAILVIGPPDVDQHGQPAVAGCGGGWAPPPTLAMVRESEHTVAEREGWYFWDWQAAMGGPCGSDRWGRRKPALAMPDHVHLRPEGYRASADALFDELMHEYDRYRARAGAPPRVSS